ncbi:MAG: hypothetical protein JNL33_16570 [Betaproteobacteria bacterium]|nr:hypothetical protein [Betaproteobacteria bacterium]
MPNFRSVDRNLKFIAVDFDAQLLHGTFEHAERAGGSANGTMGSGLALAHSLTQGPPVSRPLRIKRASGVYNGTSRGDSRVRVPKDTNLGGMPRELRIGRLSAGLQDPTPFFPRGDIYVAEVANTYWAILFGKKPDHELRCFQKLVRVT